MYYNSEEIDDDLKCSICKQKFTGDAKLIPDCGESICELCYEELKDSVNETGQFKCRACQGLHTVPESGLPDNKSLNRIAKRRKVEKSLSDETKTLQSLVVSLKDRLRGLESFDEREFINQHCDQLELEVMSEAESLVKEVNETEKDLLKQISDYRQSCLSSWSDRSAAQWRPSSPIQADESKQTEFEAFSKKVCEFSVKWTEYFSRIDALASESEVESAQKEAKQFERKMRWLRKRRESNALNGQAMTLTSKEDKSSIRRFIKLAIQEDAFEELSIQPTPLHTLIGHVLSVNQVLFVPNGKLVSCSGEGAIKMWNVADGTRSYQLKSCFESFYSMALLWNGWLASGIHDGPISIWDLDHRREIRTLRGHSDAVVALKALKNGILASYSLDNTIKIWNPFLPKQRLLLTITGHGNIHSRSLSLFGVLSNENFVTVTFNSKETIEETIRIWKRDNGLLIKSIPTGVFVLTAFLLLPDDQVVLGSDDGGVTIIDVYNEAASITFQDPDAGRISALAHLANGKLISCAYVSATQLAFIRVWELEGPSLVQTIVTDHHHMISSVAVSTDRKLLATGSSDHNIKIWSLN